MKHPTFAIRAGLRPCALTLAVTAALAAGNALAAGQITRLTPPSELFRSGQAEPVIATFAPGQRFDLQATIQPSDGSPVTAVKFLVDGVPVRGQPTLTTSGLVSGLAPASAVASQRAYSMLRPGVHTLEVVATQANGDTISATGNFRVEPILPGGRKVKNIIIMFGDGMGAAHRTAARIMLSGYAQGKAKSPLAMDTFPATALVKTASLNSIVTDSAPGMASYVNGNKQDNNQEGVFPDDTTDAFDNPRVEYLSEYLHRTQGKKLGILTTADVFDATPAANAVHTANRGAGTGIVDQYLDEADKTGLIVLMGGGRKWFLPSGTPGSARSASSDYVLPADLATGWGVPAGAKDPGRDLIADFTAAGWTYAANKSEMDNASGGKLLGLFSYSNMNVALDKIGGRRGTSTVVNDYGFPDQPMLDEMTAKALKVLDANSPNGFILMAEAASIDKQAHNMDSERWILDTIELDRAIKVAQDYAKTHPDTLVIVTADHECSGAAIIGASTVTDAVLQTKTGADLQKVVGQYEAAKFPRYTIEADGYPATTDVDYKMLIGYGANADRYEDWRTNAQPVHDTQQPFDSVAPLRAYPAINSSDGQVASFGRPLRDQAGGFLITGQLNGTTAVHTATDIPLSAFGRGAGLFNGVIDNTDVFFRFVQAAVGGVRPMVDND
jgi:alkaline phosphatase